MHADARWMREALAEARRALEAGEVPVGAVVVVGGRVVGRGHNRSVRSGQPFEHAEMVALWEAVERVGTHALAQGVLYVTVEPCTMCIGAAILARVARVVFGAREPRTGACGSVLSVADEPRLAHRPAVIGGVEADAARELMQAFFRARRQDG